ncbi:hypothetical protein PR003_g9176 [Phytophthora rubi]|uniref:Uncharacterized protein n=1 Tax=Phytophthora rubi TaxID=129364 RepID=A0A6A4FT25_9STRA|nr:hypothetical protein PR002_g22600 [Phytophthora rubi]KAE9343027.1 hypothetical protein PR003_g9176 [Phytophthora rubi]
MRGCLLATWRGASARRRGKMIVDAASFVFAWGVDAVAATTCRDPAMQSGAKSPTSRLSACLSWQN